MSFEGDGDGGSLSALSSSVHRGGGAGVERAAKRLVVSGCAPEPSTRAMILPGFGGICCELRWRKAMPSQRVGLRWDLGGFALIRALTMKTR